MSRKTSRLNAGSVAGLIVYSLFEVLAVMYVCGFVEPAGWVRTLIFTLPLPVGAFLENRIAGRADWSTASLVDWNLFVLRSAAYWTPAFFALFARDLAVGLGLGLSLGLYCGIMARAIILLARTPAGSGSDPS